MIYPPDESGGRRVRIDGTILGRAYGVQDIARFMQAAGLHDWDEMDVVRSPLIDWRGSGPDDWMYGQAVSGSERAATVASMLIARTAPLKGP